MTTTDPMTGTQASLYQQLRGHLATLKLSAAAAGPSATSANGGPM